MSVTWQGVLLTVIEIAPIMPIEFIAARDAGASRCECMMSMLVFLLPVESKIVK